MVCIPKQPQKSVFKLRESCRISTIASALVLEIQRHLRSWKCGALARLKNRFLRLFGYSPTFDMRNILKMNRIARKERGKGKITISLRGSVLSCGKNLILSVLGNAK